MEEYSSPERYVATQDNLKTSLMQELEEYERDPQCDSTRIFDDEDADLSVEERIR